MEYIKLPMRGQGIVVFRSLFMYREAKFSIYNHEKTHQTQNPIYERQ